VRFVPNHPAVHVALLGVILAGAYLMAKGPPVGDAERRVVVTGGDVLQLQASFMRTWQRDPTVQELRAALEQHIRQEVLYREALARGYDRDDLVVRRAMQRKMEFLAVSQAMKKPPTDEEIAAFFSLRRERYRLPAVVSFVQVYVNPDDHGDSTERYAQDLLARLRREDPPPTLLAGWGDRIMLPATFAAQTEQDVSGTFGSAFATDLLTVAPGGWEGPIASGYGLHLVKVLRREEARIPDWTEVRARVANDLEFEAKTSANDQLYQEIAQTYEIVLEGSAQRLLESVE
jgi:peptidyl-prolyl cis-trans isomerase C